MKINNKIFDISLWREGLRQLKIMGIMCFLITMAVAILLPLGCQQSVARYNMGIERLGFLEMSFFLLLIAFVGVPLMVFYLYRFLTTRDGSDFYHSVPHTRTCLYVSFMAAVLTWFFALVGSYLITVIVLFGIFPNIELSFTNAGVLICSYLASGIFMLGASLLAVSLTGTSLTNLAVFAMIAVLPRLVLTVSYISIVEYIDFVTVGEIRGLLNPKLNILFGLMYGMFEGRVSDPLYSWGSVAYTSIVGILYLAAGWFLFLKRKSEKAGQTAINPVLSLVFRLLPAFVVCLVPLTAILSAMRNGDSLIKLIGDHWFELLVFYVIAVLVYLLYELITTKKLSAMVKSLPGLVFLVLMNIVYGCIFMVSTSQLYNYQPEANELDGIRFVENRYTNTYQEYYEKISSEVIFKDDEILTIACDALEETRTLWKDNRSEFNRKAYGEGYEYLNMEFIENGISHSRRVIVPKEDANRLYMLMGEDIAFHEANTTLPSWKDVVYHELYANYSSMEITDEEARVLYEALKLDVSNMDYSEWKQYAGRTTDISIRFEFEMAKYPGYTLYLDVPIRAEFPTMYQAFMERFADYENTDDMNFMLDQLAKIDTLEEGDMSYYICLYKDGVCMGAREMSIYAYKSEEEKPMLEKYGMEEWNQEDFIDIVSQIDDSEESGQYILQMYLRIWDAYEGEESMYGTMRVISEETYQELLPFMSWTLEEPMAVE